MSFNNLDQLRHLHLLIGPRLARSTFFPRANWMPNGVRDAIANEMPPCRNRLCGPFCTCLERLMESSLHLISYHMWMWSRVILLTCSCYRDIIIVIVELNAVRCDAMRRYDAKRCDKIQHDTLMTAYRRRRIYKYKRLVWYGLSKRPGWSTGFLIGRQSNESMHPKTTVLSLFQLSLRG